YVSYDHEAGRIRGRSYTMSFSPGEDTIYFRAVSIPPSAGGTGQNIVDRLKIRMHLKTHLFFSLVFDEDDWDSSVRRWIDGPVRVVREVDNELSFLGVDVAPRVLVESTFYAEHHAAPTEIRQTVNIPSIAREAWLVSSVDLSEEAKGMRYYRARSPDQDPWRLIDGAPTEDERGLDPRRPPWHLVVGPQGAMIWRMDLPEPLAPITRLTFTDDESETDPPERVPGRIGEIGYRVDLFPLERGAYRMWTYYMFPPAWSLGAEQDYQRMIDRPLEVSVRSLGAL
ncbi:MAG: hypothetical protein K8I02_03645, partial [Candidatus Methylomirabilis sp.]|nr:hypothetical protein [Deltaproteobacteria bacterium]